VCADKQKGDTLCRPRFQGFLSPGLVNTKTTALLGSRHCKR